MRPQPSIRRDGRHTPQTYTPTDTANYSTVSGIEVTVHATQPIDASMFSIEDTDIRYTGNPVMPTVTSSTVPSDQYTVTYENNVAIGQATAIVTANNRNYSGTCKIPFEIKPTNAATNYQHSTTAQSGDIILTVQWNDPKLGQRPRSMYRQQAEAVLTSSAWMRRHTWIPTVATKALPTPAAINGSNTLANVHRTITSSK